MFFRLRPNKKLHDLLVELIDELRLYRWRYKYIIYILYKIKSNYKKLSINIIHNFNNISFFIFDIVKLNYYKDKYKYINIFYFI